MVRSIHKNIRSKSNQQFASWVATFLLLLSSPAWADYIPPSQPSAPRGGNTTTTGRRGGCQGDELDTLTLLAPISHVGQTVSTRPTFAWSVPAMPSMPIEFHLFAADGSLLYKTQLTSTPGIMSLSLPENQPALQVGQRYRWQVTLLCNPNRPSSAIVSRAEVEVVSLPPALETALKSSSDPASRANQLAEAGLWYDAFAAAMQNTNSQTVRRSLLTSLAAVEATGGQGDHSIQLQHLVETIGGGYSGSF